MDNSISRTVDLCISTHHDGPTNNVLQSATPNPSDQDNFSRREDTHGGTEIREL